MPDTDFSDSALPLAASADGEWIAACLVGVLQTHGVQPRQQATLVAQVCGLSISQARRKLKGAGWTFEEVLTLCRHHGEMLDAVCSAPVFTGATSAALWQSWQRLPFAV